MLRVFRGSEAVRRGLLTPHQLRGRAWVRLRQDVYADARLTRDHELACRAALVRLPPGTVLAGPSAAVLYGVRHAAGFHDDVHVIAPPSSRVESQRGLRVHSGRLVAGEVVRSGGLLVTAPARTAWDLAVWLDVVPAVAIIDGLLKRRLAGVADLAALASARAGQRGARRAARSFGLADGRAQSRPESELRVRLVLAGLPRPVPQCPVRLPSGLVLHPDLGWPDYRVAVEYDGIWHADADQLHRDGRRRGQLVGASWLVLHVTSRRLYRDFAEVEREVRAALRSRGWRRS